MGQHHRDRDWDGMVEEMKRLTAIGKGETYVFNPESQLRGSLGDSPEDSEEEAEDGGRDNAAVFRLCLKPHRLPRGMGVAWP